MTVPLPFKDVALPLLLGDFHDAAIREAAFLANRSQGRTVALVGASLAMPVGTVWSYCPAEAYATLHEAALATIASLAEAAGKRLSREAVAFEVQTGTALWLTPGEMGALHARFSDVVVFGVSRPITDAERQLAGALLYGSGRPVMVVPPGAGTGGQFDHVVIAWKPDPQAIRALHDALPLLAGARRVELLSVVGESDADDAPQAAASSLLAHLRRHHVDATWTRRPSSHGSAAETILRHVHEAAPNLVVAGAYGHSRAREQVFGGVTLALLERAQVPVMLSH